MNCPGIVVRGEEFTLLPEKLVWWSAENTLFVADTHFGKASLFRQSGIPVPTGTTTTMLRRLSRVIEATKANRLVILGDWVHSSRRNETGFENELFKWRQKHSDMELLLIRGNHDRGHGKLFTRLQMRVEAEPFNEGPFAFCHYPTANGDGSRYTLAGHVHPAIRFPVAGRAMERLECFYFDDNLAILPAFGEFTGHGIIQASANGRVYVLSGGEICLWPVVAGQC